MLIVFQTERTFIPSNRDIARRGRKALKLLKTLSEDKFWFTALLFIQADIS